jgi:GNAT superfamily N-acetyltransferase
MVFQLEPFDVAAAATVAEIWTAACGRDLAILPGFVEYNTRPATGALQAGRLAMHNDQPVGFVFASVLPDDLITSPPDVGWIDAIAVMPAFQRQGIGSALLSWAEGWLAGQGCTHSRLGASLRPFAPGLPVQLGTEAVFRAWGYGERSESSYVWDVARDLSSYDARSGLAPLASDIRILPAWPGQEEALMAFLWREFPGRWRFEWQELVREGERLADVMLLWTGRGVDGFCRMTTEDSRRPIERFYMHRLPRPWGQLGPIGVSRDCRGRGYGAALMDAALRHLKSSGVRGCVVDWTDLIEFYAGFGFEPYRQYVILLKPLAPGD